MLLFFYLCAKPLRRFPGLFYAVWTILVLAVSWSAPVVDIMQDATPAFVLAYDMSLDGLGASLPGLKIILDLFTSSYTGVCIYLIVMFVGAMRKGVLVKRFLSIRSELSVIGGIIIMGHVLRVANFPFLFTNSFWWEMWGSPAAMFMFIAAVIIGPLLTLCFLVPWITSFKAIRKKMKHSTWKKLQKLAYPFMALMIAQGFFLAIGHITYGYPYDDSYTLMAISSNPVAWLSSFAQQVATAWMYLLLGIAYVALKVRKRREKTSSKTTPAA
ncbi:MAG: hypothetical protein ACOYD7_01830 [Raoultibacter sp.]